jgi:hypothetical protein
MIKFITSTAIVVIAGIALFFTSCGSAPVSERKPIDRLDSIKTDSGIVKELKDVYRVFQLNYQLDEIRGDFSMLIDKDSNAAYNVLRNGIDKSETFKNCYFYDDSIKILFVATIDKFNIVNKAIINKGLESNEFEQAYSKFNTVSNKFDRYLFGEYSTDHFLKMSEDDYWKQINKQQYIHSPEYTNYLSLAKTDLLASITVLEKIIANTKNFQEKSIYQMELANSMICHFNKLDSTCIKKALKIYTDILEHSDYSLYKFETWRRWRAATQTFIYGPEQEAPIPNSKYDAVREKCAAQVLKYYVEHPKDQMALNQFLDFATHGIVYRGGDYEEGNQNMIEFTELFPLEKNDK